MLPVPPKVLQLTEPVTPDGKDAVCTPNGDFTPDAADALAAAARPALASVASAVASDCELAIVAVGVPVGEGTVPDAAGAGAGAGVLAAGAGAGVLAAGAGAGLVEVVVVELEPPPPQAARLDTATAANKWESEVLFMWAAFEKMECAAKSSEACPCGLPRDPGGKHPQLGDERLSTP